MNVEEYGVWLVRLQHPDSVLGGQGVTRVDPRGQKKYIYTSSVVSGLRSKSLHEKKKTTFIIKEWNHFMGGDMCLPYLGQNRERA